jgi:hypothetical protein
MFIEEQSSEFLKLFKKSMKSLMMGYAILTYCLNDDKGNYINTVFIRDYR